MNITPTSLRTQRKRARIGSIAAWLNVTLCCVLMLALLPATRGAAAQASPEASAAETAVLLSQFESRGETGRLSQYLHLDAKVLIPMEAIAGWYRDAFFPNGPQAITVTGVEIVSWTWGVTGITYPETAEVSFTQPFANGQFVEDVVRLVRDRGEWRWFFGRSLDFVNQQIARYAPDYPLLDDVAIAHAQVGEDTAPWGLEAFPGGAVDAGVLGRMVPGVVVDHVLGAVRSVDGITLPFVEPEGLLATYHTPPEPVIPSGEVHVYNVRPGYSVLDALAMFDARGSEAAYFTVLRDGRAEGAAVPFVFVELYANDAVGWVPVLYWGRADGRQLVSASMLDYVSLRLLVLELTRAM